MVREVIIHVPRVNFVDDPDFGFEHQLWEAGVKYIAGLDEAGRGSLAGPVVAGAVIFNQDDITSAQLSGVRDSKQMSPNQRRHWADILAGISYASAVGYAMVEEIEELGIVGATHLAMIRALENLKVVPDHLLIDYLELQELHYDQTCIVKGDCRSLTIAAASILAKTSRDSFMVAIDQENPGYGFKRNKGYGTMAHLEALNRLGPCKYHRKKFSPISRFLFLKENYGMEMPFAS